jgi:hypothetical protein
MESLNDEVPQLLASIVADYNFSKSVVKQNPKYPAKLDNSQSEID